MALESGPKGLNDINLKPLASVVDAWTGSNMANDYQAPPSAQNRELQLEKLRQAVGQQEAGLIDDRLNVARLLMEENRAKENNAFKANQFENDAELRKALLDKKIGAAKNLQSLKGDQKLTSGALKTDKPSADAWKAAGFAKRIDQTEEVFGNLISKGYVGPTRGEDIASYVAPNEVMGENYRQYDQASRNFINATLRRESGAAISAGEFANAKKQYLPVPGDDPATLAQKAANRRQIRENLRAEGGSAYDKIPSISATGDAKGPAQNNSGERVTVTNGTETLRIPKSSLAGALKDGFRVVP